MNSLANNLGTKENPYNQVIIGAGLIGSAAAAAFKDQQKTAVFDAATKVSSSTGGQTRLCRNVHGDFPLGIELAETLFKRSFELIQKIEKQTGKNIFETRPTIIIGDENKIQGVLLEAGLKGMEVLHNEGIAFRFPITPSLNMAACVDKSKTAGLINIENYNSAMLQTALNNGIAVNKGAEFKVRNIENIENNLVKVTFETGNEIYTKAAISAAGPWNSKINNLPVSETVYSGKRVLVSYNVNISKANEHLFRDLQTMMVRPKDEFNSYSKFVKQDDGSVRWEIGIYDSNKNKTAETNPENHSTEISKQDIADIHKYVRGNFAELSRHLDFENAIGQVGIITKKIGKDGQAEQPISINGKIVIVGDCSEGIWAKYAAATGELAAHIAAGLSKKPEQNVQIAELEKAERLIARY